jgi:mRNA interferase MazF
MTIPPAKREPLRPGELILVDFEPIRGSEQAGRRPALVVSAQAMQAAGRRAIVCPISRNLSPWPTKIRLPDGLPVTGAVLADQVRTIDHEHRVLRRLGEVPRQVLQDVREVLALLLEIVPVAKPE